MGMTLTKQEQSAVADLQALEKRWPKSLWLFSGSGTLCVMKKNASGERVMNAEVGGVEKSRCVATINIENDGGDF